MHQNLLLLFELERISMISYRTKYKRLFQGQVPSCLKYSYPKSGGLAQDEFSEIQGRGQGELF